MSRSRLGWRPKLSLEALKVKRLKSHAERENKSTSASSKTTSMARESLESKESLKASRSSLSLRHRTEGLRLVFPSHFRTSRRSPRGPGLDRA